MSKLQAAINSFLFVLAILILSLAFSAAVQPGQAVGVALPQGAAVFETSLQSRISSTDTSMTLVSNAIRGSESLSGYNCFTIDEGRSDSEFVCGDVSGTSVTNLERGLSFSTGTTTVSALRFAHRVGASVKITDYPLIQRMRHQLAGSDTILNVLKYATTTPECAAAGELCDYGFISDLAFSGASVLDASTAAKGVVEVATQAEGAASASTGSTGALLVLPSSMSTSTYATTTAPSRLVMTRTDGTIDPKFFGTTTLVMYPSLQVTFGATTTFSAPVVGISGKIAATTTSGVYAQAASTTVLAYTIPANTLGISNYVRFTVYIKTIQEDEGTCLPGMGIGFGGATTTFKRLYPNTVERVVSSGRLEFLLMANGSTASQRHIANLELAHGTTTSVATTSRTFYKENTSSVDTTSNRLLTFEVDPSTSCYYDFAAATLEVMK